MRHRWRRFSNHHGGKCRTETNGLVLYREWIDKTENKSRHGGSKGNGRN